MAIQNKYKIEMFQGATFFLNVTLKNADGTLKDLADSSARMQIRDSYCSNNLIESLSTSNGEITIDSGTSTLNLVLSAARTANMNVNSCNNDYDPPRAIYVYDLEVEQPGQIVTKALIGDVVVYAEVTK